MWVVSSDSTRRAARRYKGGSSEQVEKSGIRGVGPKMFFYFTVDIFAIGTIEGL